MGKSRDDLLTTTSCFVSNVNQNAVYRNGIIWALTMMFKIILEETLKSGEQSRVAKNMSLGS